MAKWSTYPQYKDSGVPWADSAPAHWEIKPAFVHCYEKSIKNETGQVTNVLSLSYGRIVRRNVEEHFGLLPASFDTYQIVKPGDLMLRLTDLQNDKRSLRVGYVNEKGIITSAYLCLVCKKGFDKKYAFYLLHAYDINKVFYGMGGGLRQTMKFDDLKRMPIFVPPLNEQLSIADFLDHETAKIDHLIAKQERLIELLKEKRQAVISHAVTKGLNPDAPMKDSGVEWLGEVPTHWDVLQLKRLLKGIDYGISESGDSSGTFEVLGMGDIKEGKVNRPGKKFVDEVDSGLLLEFNDILFNRTNSLALVGKSGIFKGKEPELVTFASYLVRFRARSDVNPDYLNYLLNIPTVLAQARSLALPSISQANLNPNRYAYIHLCLPPRPEQDKIVDIIEKRGRLFSKLINKAEKSVELMKEHRTALISAAVTGKIDVRDWQKPEQQSQQAAKTATG